MSDRSTLENSSFQRLRRRRPALSSPGVRWSPPAAS